MTYFYMLMADISFPYDEALEKAAYENGLEEFKSYKNALRFGDDELKEKLELLNNRTVYNFANSTLTYAKSREDCMKAKRIFENIIDFFDAKEKIAESNKKVIEVDYKKAVWEMERPDSNDKKAFTDIALDFDALGDYKDSKERAEQCRKNSEKEAIYLEAKDLYSRGSDPYNRNGMNDL